VLNRGINFISVSTVFLLGVGTVQEGWESDFYFNLHHRNQEVRGHVYVC